MELDVSDQRVFFQERPPRIRCVAPTIRIQGSKKIGRGKQRRCRKHGVPRIEAVRSVDDSDQVKVRGGDELQGLGFSSLQDFTAACSAYCEILLGTNRSCQWDSKSLTGVSRTEYLPSSWTRDPSVGPANVTDLVQEMGLAREADFHR